MPSIKDPGKQRGDGLWGIEDSGRWQGCVMSVTGADPTSILLSTTQLEPRLESGKHLQEVIRMEGYSENKSRAGPDMPVCET